jgi:hypothetical protein
LAGYDETIAKLNADLENSSGVAAEELRRRIEEEQKLKEKAAIDDEKLRKKQAARNKAFAVADWALKSAQAIMNVIVSTAADITGISRAIGIAQVTIASGLQLGAILSANYMAKGGSIPVNGVIQGRSHAEGGVLDVINGQLVEAERGEYFTYAEDGAAIMINKIATSRNRALLDRIAPYNFHGKKAMLSAINQQGGGVAFAQQGISIPSPSNFAPASTMQSPMQMQQMLELMTERIVPVLAVQDVTAKQNERLTTAKVVF